MFTGDLHQGGDVVGKTARVLLTQEGGGLGGYLVKFHYFYCL
jgi:hypothetical protein